MMRKVNFLIFFYTLCLKQKFINDFFTSVGQNVSPALVLKHINYFIAIKCVSSTGFESHYLLYSNKMCLQIRFWNTLFTFQPQNVSPDKVLKHIIYFLATKCVSNPGSGTHNPLFSCKMCLQTCL